MTKDNSSRLEIQPFFRQSRSRESGIGKFGLPEADFYLKSGKKIAMNGQKMTTIDIISDPICPWCYIGKTRLDRALEANPAHDFVIEWHPYQLNPTMPADGMERREYLETKFGGQEAALKVYGQIDQTAREMGLELNFAGIKRTPNTLNSHRLIHWAGIEGCQNAVVDRLFKAYFMEGRDISDVSVLVRIADAAGMDADATRRLLESDANIEDIRSRDTKSRESGVQGVPCFVIDNHYVVSGAQPTEMWDGVIKEILGKVQDAK